MDIPRKFSIRKITKVYETNGSKPVRVECNDFHDYVVKYKSSADASNLFREFVGASFLKIWELHVPEFAFVKVDPDHVPLDLHPKIQPHYFDSICFGSKHVQSFEDVTRHMLTTSEYWRKGFILNKELLSIALFDIWTVNIDRNYNNPNLMVDHSQQRRFVPIDHQRIFDDSMFEYKLSPLTEGDSILSFPQIKSLFRKKELTNADNIDLLKENYYIWVENCKENLGLIIEHVPKDWNINSETIMERITDQIFDESWIKNSWNNFIQILQQLVNQY